MHTQWLQLMAWCNPGEHEQLWSCSLPPLLPSLPSVCEGRRLEALVPGLFASFAFRVWKLHLFVNYIKFLAPAHSVSADSIIPGNKSATHTTPSAVCSLLLQPFWSCLWSSWHYSLHPQPPFWGYPQPFQDYLLHLGPFWSHLQPSWCYSLHLQEPFCGCSNTICCTHSHHGAIDTIRKLAFLTRLVTLTTLIPYIIC